MANRILLNAFTMNCVGHQSPGLWTYPGDEATRYTELSYWADLARVLEEGQFDAVFFADVLGVYDVYQGSPDAALRNAVQIPVNDPMLVVPAMALVTKRLGFAVTASVTYEHPVLLARRLSTLDHVTQGRIGWNIVTSYLDSAARNLGLTKQLPHDKRYDLAEDFLAVCYKLWEASWEDDAVIRDAARGVYAQPDKVHEVRHRGPYFDVRGIHLCEPSPQRTPVLFQAGASKRGRQFAARHAECVFISVPTIDHARRYVRLLRDDVESAGRDARHVKVFASFTPVVGRTEAEARERLERYRAHASLEGALVLLSGWTGVDFSKFTLEQTLPHADTNAMQSVIDTFAGVEGRRAWTVAQMAEWVATGGRSPVVAGTPARIADVMETWVEQAGVDGFNITYITSPGTFVEFVEHVVPELQRRGLVTTSQRPVTLRERLFGEAAHLPADHPARRV